MCITTMWFIYPHNAAFDCFFIEHSFTTSRDDKIAYCNVLQFCCKYMCMGDILEDENTSYCQIMDKMHSPKYEALNFVQS